MQIVDKNSDIKYKYSSYLFVLQYFIMVEESGDIFLVISNSYNHNFFCPVICPNGFCGVGLNKI